MEHVWVSILIELGLWIGVCISYCFTTNLAECDIDNLKKFYILVYA